MTSLDIPFIINTIFVAIVGSFFGGIVGAWVTHVYQRKRDDIAWEREKEKLKKSFEHERDMLELQFQQRLDELQKQLSQQQSAQLRNDILKGVDNPQRAINAIRTLEGLPIYESISAGPTGTIDMSPPQSTEHAVILEGIVHILCPVKSISDEEFQVLIDECTQIGWINMKSCAMNRSHPIPIDENDYVLVGNRKEINDNDIVFVSVSTNFENSFTIRRYKKAENCLLSESADPRYINRSIQITQDVELLAVVLGVAKAKRIG